ncbi:hypothetical protein [Symmachiella dynata]|uniref:hypothetical protein n=1 Tax=Symmachiella dynata TaxID=2527995 RepID=UPI0030EBE070|tara:strand:- start:150 stop:578 length:429 start_codon:yes stop_codon:yes gene_type:complete
MSEWMDGFNLLLAFSLFCQFAVGVCLYNAADNLKVAIWYVVLAAIGLSPYLLIVIYEDTPISALFVDEASIALIVLGPVVYGVTILIALVYVFSKTKTRENSTEPNPSKRKDIFSALIPLFLFGACLSYVCLFFEWIKILGG